MSFDEDLQQTIESLTETLTERLREAAASLSASAVAERDRAVSDAIADIPPPPPPAPPPPEVPIDRLVDAFRSIDAAPSLTDVLDVLAVGVGSVAARAALLLVRQDKLQGWRFVGFDPPVAEAQGVELPLADAGVMARAVRSRETALSDSLADDPLVPFPPLSSGSRPVAVPIVIANDVVAVVYADGGAESDESSSDRSVAVWRGLVEILGRHAARRLEAITAFKAARAAAQQPRAQAASDGDDEESARRYARLLVSEIKLYHEADVNQGRRERDLATRLGGEIARARTLYEQRVPQDLRAQTDYFDAELVKTLADGDASLLGSAT